MQLLESICPNCFAGGYSGREPCAACGCRAGEADVSPIALRPGTLLNNRYILGKVLGMGGFGVTYLAMDRMRDVRCAVKEYLPAQIAARDSRSSYVQPTGSAPELYRHGMEAFTQEARLLKEFFGVPAIVQVWDYFEQYGTAYFVMEYLDGVTLRALAKSMGGKIPLPYALEIFGAVGGALNMIHRQGMLHRDISPENIMVTGEGQFKLIDFGSMRHYVGRHSESAAIVLKHGFAPPEQYSAQSPQGPWLDVYAMAASFYAAVSGAIPPSAIDRMAGKECPPLHRLEPQVGPELSRALERALELDYKKRFQEVGSFLSQLLPAGGVKPPTIPPRKAAQPPVRGEERRGGPDRPPPRARPRPVRGKPSLRMTFPGGEQRWLLPENTDMVIGASPMHSNIVVPLQKGGPAHCQLRYDRGEGVFRLTSILPYGVCLSDGTRLQAKHTHVLHPGEFFYLLSRDNTLTVEVEPV